MCNLDSWYVDQFYSAPPTSLPCYYDDIQLQRLFMNVFCDSNFYRSIICLIRFLDDTAILIPSLVALHKVLTSSSL